jgi:hypothetical protein
MEIELALLFVFIMRVKSSFQTLLSYERFRIPWIHRFNEQGVDGIMSKLYKQWSIKLTVEN